MRLQEAILDRDRLNQSLELLQSRVNDDHRGGRVRPQELENIVQISNRLKDLDVAISWTKQRMVIAGLTLKAYQIRRDSFKRLAEIIETIDSSKADLFLESAHADNKVLENAYWLIDLQFPGVDQENPKEEEED